MKFGPEYYDKNIFHYKMNMLSNRRLCITIEFDIIHFSLLQ